jgi:hypothetical protein
MGTERARVIGTVLLCRVVWLVRNNGAKGGRVRADRIERPSQHAGFTRIVRPSGRRYGGRVQDSVAQTLIRSLERTTVTLRRTARVARVVGERNPSISEFAEAAELRIEEALAFAEAVGAEVRDKPDRRARQCP